MTVDARDSALVEVRLINGRNKAIEPGFPVLCWILVGPHYPKTFAYGVYPLEKKPNRLDLGTRFAPKPEPFPRYGWVNLDYVGSPQYAERHCFDQNHSLRFAVRSKREHVHGMVGVNQVLALDRATRITRQCRV